MPLKGHVLFGYIDPRCSLKTEVGAGGGQGLCPLNFLFVLSTYSVLHLWVGHPLATQALPIQGILRKLEAVLPVLAGLLPMGMHLHISLSLLQMQVFLLYKTATRLKFNEEHPEISR